MGRKVLSEILFHLNDQDIRNERQDQRDKWQMDGEVEDVYICIWGRNWEKNVELK